MEFSLVCLVHNVKKIAKKVLEGTVNFLMKYSLGIVGEITLSKRG